MSKRIAVQLNFGNDGAPCTVCVHYNIITNVNDSDWAIFIIIFFFNDAIFSISAKIYFYSNILWEPFAVLITHFAEISFSFENILFFFFPNIPVEWHCFSEYTTTIILHKETVSEKSIFFLFFFQFTLSKNTVFHNNAKKYHNGGV